MENEWNLPVAFYFRVSFLGLPGMPIASFQEVSGLECELETEEIAEGGENYYTHSLIRGRKQSNLVLKKIIGTLDQGVESWINQTFASGLNIRIIPCQLQISLLNADGNPMCSWEVLNAYPTKWNIGAFNAERNELATETIEFKYHELIRIT